MGRHRAAATSMGTTPAARRRHRGLTKLAELSRSRSRPSSTTPATRPASPPGAIDREPSLGLVRGPRRTHRPERPPRSRSPARHIRPQPGYGYDERRHVNGLGAARPCPATGSRSRRPGLGLGRGRSPVLRVLRALVAQSRAILRRASAERDAVKPRLSFGFLALGRPASVPDRDDRAGRPRQPDRGDATVRSTSWRRLDLAVPASSSSGSTSPTTCSTRRGRRRGERDPDPVHGGSRVLQYGLVSLRQMATALDRVLHPSPASSGSCCSPCGHRRRCLSSVSSGSSSASAIPRRR